MINYFWIEIKGKNIKYILNKIFKKDINILKIKYYKDKVLLKVSYEDYKKIKEIKTTYEINIIKTCGKKKIYEDLIKYKVTIIIFIISIFFLVFLTNFILFINIDVQNSKLKNSIKEELKNNDITLFTTKKSYNDLEKIKNNIKNKNSDIIEWIEISNKGVTLKVKVIERIKKEFSNDEEYKDIVASKNGYIRKIYSSKGQLLKNIDDYVKKGEVIISGNIFRNDKVIDKVKANGKVYAEVWYVVKVSGDLNYTNLKKQDKGYYKIVLKINNNEINLFKIKKKIKKIQNKTLFENKDFSLIIKKENIYASQNIKYKDNELQKILEEKAKNSINKELDKTEYITYQKTLKKVKENDKMNIEVFFKVYEDIAKEENLQEITENKEEG